MQDQREPGPAEATRETLQPRVVVGVAVRQDDGAQIGRVDLQHVQVVNGGVAAEPRVVENGGGRTAVVHGDHQREPVLRPQLVPFGPVLHHRRAPCDLVAREQQIDVRVDEDRHVHPRNRAQRRLPAHALMVRTAADSVQRRARLTTCRCTGASYPLGSASAWLAGPW